MRTKLDPGPPNAGFPGLLPGIKQEVSRQDQSGVGERGLRRDWWAGPEPRAHRVPVTGASAPQGWHLLCLALSQAAGAVLGFTLEFAGEITSVT